jgi:flavin reductase (DIM6/NTAB) family NADH-FMN oxidoreductase RutF
MSVVTSDAFRRAMASFAASVTVVTTIDAAGRHHGVTVTAFSSLSLEPPLCLVCIDKGASVSRAFREGAHFAVNVLASDQEALSVRFSGPDGARFAGVRWRAGDVSGCALIDGSIATAECALKDVLPGGDHDILVGMVRATSSREGAPLVYFRGGYADLTPRS